jgi:formylglycine-generating enzyme required for sulfatase activity
MTTHPVGQKKPNAWGLFDMHGNAAEWTADRYSSTYYKGSPKQDPTGAAAGGNGSCVRGGDFRDSPLLCRSASRLGIDRANGAGIVGFRVACDVLLPDDQGKK